MDVRPDSGSSADESTDDGSSADESESRPDDAMYRRGSDSRLRLWILLHADRSAVVAVLLGGFFLALVALGALDPTPITETVGSKDPIETLFQALLTAIVTGVTLVVTINQLVLSQELGAVGDQRDRMDRATTFRDGVADVVGRPVSPADPATFLRVLVEETAERADAVAEALPDTGSDDREAVADYADDVGDNARQVREQLDGAQFGTFDVLSAALGFNYSLKVYQGKRLRAAVDDEDTGSALSALVDALELFGPAREHFKTLYFQWELIDLSRAMLYAALPALLVSGGMILYADGPGTVVGVTLGVANLVWVVAGATVVSLVPFAILVAYILRIATVAKRTLAMGPFVLRDTPSETGWFRDE